MEYTIKFSKKRHFGEPGEAIAVLYTNTTPQMLTTLISVGLELVKETLSQYEFFHNFEKRDFRVDFAKKLPNGSWAVVGYPGNGTYDTSDHFNIMSAQVQSVAITKDDLIETIMIRIN